MRQKFSIKQLLLTGLMTFLCLSFLEAQTWNTALGRLYASPTTTRVGIGTTAPSSSYMLHVTGGNNNKHGLYAYTYGANKRSIYAVNSYSTGWAAYFYGRTYLRGNVGINTTNPTEKLHVNGNLRVDGDIDVAINKRIQIGPDTGSRLIFHAASCCPGAYIDYDNGPLVFRVQGSNSTSPLTLQSNGTVVINPSAIYNGNVINTNGHELSVNGGIWCEEVEVTANVPSSDFVFYDDYELMPLKELEKFVKENHHLPEIPSAEEFKKNGYKLGDMDDLLLRKVEELSLYTIAADKQIEQLEHENDQLLERLAKMEARLNALENKE